MSRTSLSIRDNWGGSSAEMMNDWYTFECDYLKVWIYCLLIFHLTYLSSDDGLELEDELELDDEFELVEEVAVNSSLDHFSRILLARYP